MIRRSHPDEIETICAVINEGAERYRGIIPADRLRHPYMSLAELEQEIADGVTFWVCEQQGGLSAVMGIQAVRDVTLIRHAYVRTANQGQGIGGRLLAALTGQASSPILIGTWADATWAIGFYQKHGFRQVSPREKERLLRTYWTVPERQIETSIVLADKLWHSLNPEIEAA